MLRRMWWIVPLAMAGFAAFVALGGYVVMRLWNWLTPELFGWHAVTFWQALGLLLLCRILVGGFGMHGGGPRGHFRDRMRARWERMTPEERERFRHPWRGRTFGGASEGEPAGQ